MRYGRTLGALGVLVVLVVIVGSVSTLFRVLLGIGGPQTGVSTAAGVGTVVLVVAVVVAAVAYGSRSGRWLTNPYW